MKSDSRLCILNIIHERKQARHGIKQGPLPLALMRGELRSQNLEEGGLAGRLCI